LIERELVLYVKPEIGIRATIEGVASAVGADISKLANFIKSEGIFLEPLFGKEERLSVSAASFLASTGINLPNLSSYYRVRASDNLLDGLANKFRKIDAVQAAYVKPPSELPELNDMLPSAEDVPPVTPDLIARQEYLEVAPGGIDARYAWTLPGGGGNGVRIIDIEGAWRFTHEDLLQNQGGVVGGVQSVDIKWRNHGTAVVGEFGADRNSVGITGTSPDANVRAISIFGGTGSANAIRQAADMLHLGDVILIELHRAGPRYNFQPRDDQKGYIAIEWWPDDFDAIKYATDKGVIVVEAAGNGAEDLDDPLYSARPANFPASWTNPFNRVNRDSGAIIVGAGAPPMGTHLRSLDPDRSRLEFSNFGSVLDAQGWGREVTTCGYGDLQGGSEDNWYTDRFSGTSSASPIVVGAIACVQGILLAKGKSPLTPTEARTCLRSTGSQQQAALGRPATQRIGNRPNLKQLIASATSIHEPQIVCDICGFSRPTSEMVGKCFKCGKQLCSQCATKKGAKVYCPVHKPICYIATAAYGTPIAKEIDILRGFRDEELEPHWLGRQLVYLYYDTSPPLAEIISRSENLKAFVRLSLKPIIRSLQSRSKLKKTLPETEA
jgi:hypothetical protein